MRYEWGLAVGHTYAYKDATKVNETVIAGRNWGRIGSTGGPEPGSVNDAIHPISSASSEGEQNTIPLRQEPPDALDLPPGESGENEGQSDEESCPGDDEDYFSEPGQDSEDEKEAELFG